ncbi:hypothetical protein BABINDRAFT_162586 [Babjeviella inositovora NRRL Y-12698]|uniref:ATP11 protein n=1 Tax=Babjeviella inositovora NRRL Y-12698 TaxID=984486 RepID=A0A1E3QML5_9ASCO|nr:uncharacterized protein BABINDRAFT_162586 [Babjeviella inositovora NRRL Y-12698]ODQ78929.1 hypothetical protein BABINDRAFT_162586 [Babjeviella inositovora NRRL Y-12698]
MAEEHKAKKATEKKARGPRSAEVPEKPFKTLESFVDVNKISQLTKQEVEFIWRARFLGKEGAMHAVAPTRIFKRMYDNARKHAMFILPLPKDNSDGVEMHFVQWAFVGPHTAHCMITTVAEYKLHKEYARPHTTLMFHSELSELQGLVLMNGAVEKESSITLPEAQLLVLNVQRFYGALEDSPANQRRLKLLADFSSGSPDFTVEELIIEAAAMEN